MIAGKEGEAWCRLRLANNLLEILGRLIYLARLLEKLLHLYIGMQFLSR